MDRQMYFALAQAVAVAACLLLVAIACVIHSQPMLIPILLFGSLGLVVDLALISKYWFTFLPLAMFMYGLIHYILDRAKYPTDIQMTAAASAVPAWARTTPTSAEILRKKEETRRHSYEAIFSNTGERPITVQDLVARSAAERKELKAH